MPPTAQDHRSWAKQNQDFYEHIGGSQSSWAGWPMTALFYVVVHEVLAFLADRNVHPRSHKETKATLRGNPQWTTLATMYEQLFGYSRDARYRCRRHTPEEIKLAEALVEMVRAEIATL